MIGGGRRFVFEREIVSDFFLYFGEGRVDVRFEFISLFVFWVYRYMSRVGRG